MSIAYGLQAASQFVTTYSPCKGIQDSLGFWIARRGFRISRWWISVFVGGTWIQIAIVGGIPDSLSCIPDSKAQDFGFKSKFSQILDPTRKTFLDSGMRIPLHQAASSLFPAFRSCGVWPEIRERETITNKTLRSVHFGVVIAELIDCKCGGIVRNEIW